MATPKFVGCAIPSPAEDISLAKALFKKFREQFSLSLHSPLVICLASGSLNIHSFQHFIAQDAHFLKAFAQALKSARVCADDDDKSAISNLRNRVWTALEMHNSFLKEWGLDIVEGSPIDPTTLKYTEFVAATAAGNVEGLKALGRPPTPFEKSRIPVYTLGTITPCLKMYACLGIEVKEVVGDPNEYDHHPYKRWIQHYSSKSLQSFHGLSVETDELLDKLSVTLTGAELKTLEKLYFKATKLELEFFHAQVLTQPTVAPLMKEGLDPGSDRIVIFPDFDLTCTVVDSCAILAEIGIITARKSDDRDQPESEEGQSTRKMSSSELKNKWDELSQRYFEEYKQCINNNLPHNPVEFNYETLHAFLEKVSDFEKRANTRVIEAGVLKGMKFEDIKRVGEKLVLQDGCLRFLQKIAKSDNLNADTHVISYCWCSDFIRAAFSSRGLDAVNVHANELSFEESVSTGEIVLKVQSPIDKVRVFDDIVQRCSGGDTTCNLRTVYIGDNVGDLLCLLKADIGIVIGSSPSLKVVAQHYGISFLPLFHWLVKKQKEYDQVQGSHCVWERRSGIIYRANSWDEIHAVFFGY